MPLAHGGTHINGCRMYGCRSCHVVLIRPIVYVCSLLLVTTCTAGAEPCPLDGCPADEQIVDEEVSDVLNLLQIGLSVQKGRRVPEAGLTKQTAKVKNERLEPLSVPPKQSYSPSMALKLSVLATASTHQQNTTSNEPKVSRPAKNTAYGKQPISGRSAAASVPKKSTMSNPAASALLHRRSLANKVMQPMSVGFGIVGAIVLACGFLYSLELGGGQAKLQQGAPCRPRWTKFGAADDRVGPDEVWIQHGTAKARLNILFGDIDAACQSADSPPGYMSLSDLQHAMKDHRVAAEMESVGISCKVALTIFHLLDEDQDGLVDQQEFVDGCLEMGAKNEDLRL